MLTLSRKSGETIRIGEDIFITIKRIEPDLVKIGIQAPADVKIYREEIYLKMKSLNLQASSQSSGRTKRKSLIKLLEGLHNSNNEDPTGPSAK